MNALEYLENVDINTFIDFPRTCSKRNQAIVKIDTDGRTWLYGTQRKLAQTHQQDYRARISPDGRCIIMQYTEEPSIHFRTCGCTVQNEKMLDLLQRKGIQLPVSYKMEWLDEMKAWVGCCSDLPDPDLTVIRRKTRKSTKGR